MNIKKGFSIIELIVVMAILAILMLIAIPSFSGLVADAKTVQVNSDFNSMYKVVNIGATMWQTDSDFASEANNGNMFDYVYGETNLPRTALQKQIERSVPPNVVLTKEESQAFAMGYLYPELSSNYPFDDDESTWGVMISFSAPGKVENIYIANSGKASVNGGKPRPASDFSKDNPLGE